LIASLGQPHSETYGSWVVKVVAAGVYLLKVSDDWTKVGRSNQLEKRTAWWQSHGLELLWQKEMHPVDTVWLEYAMLRATLPPTIKQIKQFQRKNPTFPNNRNSLPSGWSEWRCVGPDQAVAMIETFVPMIEHLGAYVPRTAGAQFHGLWWLRCSIPPADSMAKPCSVYQGPVPSMINRPLPPSA